MKDFSFFCYFKIFIWSYFFNTLENKNLSLIRWNNAITQKLRFSIIFKQIVTFSTKYKSINNFIIFILYEGENFPYFTFCVFLTVLKIPPFNFSKISSDCINLYKSAITQRMVRLFFLFNASSLKLVAWHVTAFKKGVRNRQSTKTIKA